MRSVSYVALADITTATLTGSPIPATQVTQCTVIASVAGATLPVGTLKLQASNDQAPGFPTSDFVPTTWVDVKTTAVSGNGSYQITYTNVAYEWLRVVYEATSGSGGLVTATFEGVGPGATSGMAPGGDLAGTQSTQEVIGITGIPIESGAPSNGEVLAYNSSTQELEWSAGGGGGGVTAVTAASPLDSSGGSTPVISLAGTIGTSNGGTGVTTTSANTVFAGPTSGGAAAPAFRTLGYSDLPAAAVSIYAISATSGSVAIDLTAGSVQTQTVSGTTSYTATGLSATLAYNTAVVITASGTQTVSFDSSWKWIGLKPTSIATGTVAVLVLVNSGANATDIIASWQVLG